MDAGTGTCTGRPQALASQRSTAMPPGLTGQACDQTRLKPRTSARPAMATTQLRQWIPDGCALFVHNSERLGGIPRNSRATADLDP